MFARFDHFQYAVIGHGYTHHSADRFALVVGCFDGECGFAAWDIAVFVAVDCDMHSLCRLAINEPFGEGVAISIPYGGCQDAVGRGGRSQCDIGLESTIRFAVAFDRQRGHFGFAFAQRDGQRPLHRCLHAQFDWLTCGVYVFGSLNEHALDLGLRKWIFCLDSRWLSYFENVAFTGLGFEREDAAALMLGAE